MLNGAEYITTDTIYLRMLNVDHREHNECQPLQPGFVNRGRNVR